jgi:hypothetical protein
LIGTDWIQSGNVHALRHAVRLPQASSISHRGVCRRRRRARLTCRGLGSQPRISPARNAGEGGDTFSHRETVDKRVRGGRGSLVARMREIMRTRVASDHHQTRQIFYQRKSPNTVWSTHKNNWHNPVGGVHLVRPNFCRFWKPERQFFLKKG